MATYKDISFDRAPRLPNIEFGQLQWWPSDRLRRACAGAKFIAILGGMDAWRIATRAQNAQRMPRIGYLMDCSGPGLFDEGFLSGLREHGYEAGPSSIGGPKAKRNDSQN
jgi:hypothetical protein